MHGMRPFGELVPKEDALARLLAAAPPVARTERVPLREAAGRVAAADVRAPFDVPSFDRSTMDGYALRSADAATPGARLRVAGDIMAGARPVRPLAPGEAMRIATGAPLPEGADAVARVEDTVEEAGVVTVRVAIRGSQSVDPAGSDLARGAIVVRAGQPLSPARLGLLASVGMAHVDAFARPRVALFSSGDELLRPGEALAPGRIHDANTTTLGALCEAHGAAVAVRPALPDALDATRAAIRDAAHTSDVVVVSGGASAGARDLVVDALRALGEVDFHGVRVKPGKPLLAGRIGACLVVGLPGNPTSALSNACLFLAPALRQMAHLPPASALATNARLAVDVKGDPERFLFLPVRLDAEGARPTFKGSGALTSMSESDGWIGVPEGASLPAGSLVEVHPW